MNKKKIISLSLCAIFALQSNLFAQENQKEVNDSTTLESIDIVDSSNNNTEDTGLYTIGSMNTSTKLNLSIKDTPQSLVIISSQELEDKNITSYDKLLENIAGITVNRWDERLNSSARGFVIDYYKVDGMPTYTEYNARDVDLDMFDRVEVVKGANGLTTGAGNPALAINLVRKRANSKELSGDVTIKAGSWDAYSALVDVGSALNESGSVRARVVVKHEESDSFMDGYEKTNDLFYAVVDADLSDSTYLSIGASYSNLERSGIRWGGLPAFYSDGSATSFDRSDIVSEDWTKWNVETKSVFADFKQVFKNDIRLNASASYDEIYAQSALLYFAGSVNESDGSGLYSLRYEDENLNHQSNIDVNINVPFEINNLSQEIVLGASYNKDARKQNDFSYLNGATGAGLTYLSVPNFYDYDISSSSSSPYSLSGENEQTIQKALYLAGNFDLSKKLKLIAGTRVSSWKYESEDASKETREFTGELTPYLGLVYDVDGTHSVYASYTDIFNPQSAKDTSGNYLDPKIGKAYEAGIKADYFDGKLNATLSIFQIKQDNVAEKIDGVYVDGEQAYSAVEGVTSKGFELELSGKINDNFTLDFGLANFEAKDADGEKVSTTSARTTANIFAKYKVKDLSLGAGLNYKSKFYTGSGTSKIQQDAYVITNLMAAYKVDKSTSIQLNLENLFDEEYYDGLGTNSMVYGSPRSATLTLKYRF